MSQLFHSETGRVLYLESEEVARWRHARKVFHLPRRFAGGGTLFVLAKSRKDCCCPLRVRVNGRPAGSIAPDHHYYLSWFTLRLRAADLRGGRNVVEFSADNEAMDGWLLGLEPGARAADSALSVDAGRTWQRERLGVHHALCGEYVVRLRLDDPALCDPAPPPFVWERPDCPRFAALRAALPARLRAFADPWRRARALSTWLSAQWPYRDDPGGPRDHHEYSPWDPLTTLSWQSADFGQYQSRPVAFCVHFGAAYVPFALALGLPTRALCGSSGTLARRGGHFVAEVWIEAWRKWCYVDPTCDFVFERGGMPLSLAEAAALTEPESLACLRHGPRFRHLPEAKQRSRTAVFGTGVCFREWALWPRNDFLSHPECTPPSHGATYYAETDWRWVTDAPAAAADPFPYHVAPAAVAPPPPRAWRR